VCGGAVAVSHVAELGVLQATVDGDAAYERAIRWNNFQHDDVGSQVTWRAEAPFRRARCFGCTDCCAGMPPWPLRLQRSRRTRRFDIAFRRLLRRHRCVAAAQESRLTWRASCGVIWLIFRGRFSERGCHRRQIHDIFPPSAPGSARHQRPDIRHAAAVCMVDESKGDQRGAARWASR
jgi:hypothetical protein